MADNVNLTAGDGTIVAGTDTIGGVAYPRAKVVWGPDGTVNDADVATGKPLPVQLRSSTGTAITPISPDVGSGTGGSATQRVIVDSSQFSSLGSNTSANSQPVVIASDQGAVAVKSGATGSAVPASAVYDAVNASTALPSAATAGNLTGIMGDKFGRTVILPITIRDLTGTQTTTISASTSEITIVTAAASVFNDLVMLVVSNTSASTNTRIDFRDTTAGTILFSLQSNGGQPPIGFCPAVAIPQTSVNTNWTAQCATSTTDIRIYAVFAKNK